MLKERFFDLGPGDVVAGADDHVVGARLVVEVPVPIAHVHVSGDVPAVSNVGPLAVAAKVAAARRPLDSQPSALSIGHRLSVLVLELRDVARPRQTRAAAVDLL